MDTKGGKPWWGGDGGVLNWAIGIDMYTLMCIKLMTDLKKYRYSQSGYQIEGGRARSKTGAQSTEHFRYQSRDLPSTLLL